METDSVRTSTDTTEKKHVCKGVCKDCPGKRYEESRLSVGGTIMSNHDVATHIRHAEHQFKNASLTIIDPEHTHDLTFHEKAVSNDMMEDRIQHCTELLDSTRAKCLEFLSENRIRLKHEWNSVRPG